MNKRAFLILAATALAAGCTPGGGGEAPPLEGARIGGPFTLVDQDGRTVTDRDFAGQWRAVYFGYTFCPDVCPVDLQRLMQGYRLFAKDHPQAAAKLRPIFITVDPERDTPAVMKTYVAAFGPSLTGLTGTPEQIAATAKAFAVYYQKRRDPGASEYLMDHARTTILFDGAGRPIALLPTEASAAQVADELAKWVR